VRQVPSARGRVNRKTKWTFAPRRADLPHLSSGRRMYQKFLLLLAVILVAVTPVWSYNSNWSFGPFLAVLFLLGVNLVNFLLQDPLTLTGADHQRH
jgi:hypothetical protein